MQEQLQELQKTLYAQVPLSEHVRVSVQSYDTKSFRLDAPLAGNSNPSGTGFGGSLNVTLTLAGWCLIWFVVQELKLESQAEIIIHDSTCKYQLPITKDFSAYSYRPSEEQIERFEKTLRTKGRGSPGGTRGNTAGGQDRRFLQGPLCCNHSLMHL